MSLYDKSSLIQVPSLYKDGTLVSTIPEDRSGDFTVVRGSNLSATRVGEDGYIKKGYENLLLQSNTFTDATWAKTGLTFTSGQSGYDGSNDAWLIEKDANGYRPLAQNISASGVNTFSVYLKAGTLTEVTIVIFRTGLSDPQLSVDLSQGTISPQAPYIDSSIISLGNGWYRVTGTIDGTIYRTSIYADIGVSVAGSIYIQDAQLNQGLVAYPYLETTTAPVQGGLLENTPRLDWSNGVPAVKLEEGSTNLIVQSEYLGSNWNYYKTNYESNITTSPEGLTNAAKVVANTSLENHYFERIGYTGFTSGNYTYSFFAKSAGSDFVQIATSTGFDSRYQNFNLTTGTKASGDADLSGYDTSITPIGDDGWYRVTITANAPSTSVRFLIVPILTDAGRNPIFAGDGTSGVYIYGAQMEQDATYPTSYIPTYGTSQTRGSETISDNFNIPTTATIYNSFYSDVAETVFVLDQVFDVVEGLNKVAIAFSPTAVKISVGGSIVANATGTYDTTALSNIQLGSNNGTDYSNAPISGFYVFPEFLTDEELNSLTA
jgi:hypothetical protein